MAERIPIGKKLRFEIFKRDSFTCQYCGKKAPDVVLEVDHIKPVASGGDNGLLNLVTSCYDCNHGKGARELSDDSVVTKQRDQLDNLQERREQIDMMIEWQSGLSDIAQYELDSVAEILNNYLPEDMSLSSDYKNTLRKLINKYGMADVLEAINIGEGQYLEYTGIQATISSVNLLLDKLPGICKAQKMYKENPDLSVLFHAKNIICKRFGIRKGWREFNLIKEAYDSGVRAESLLNWSRKANGMNEWISVINKCIRGNNEHGE